jgi:aryl-alcohol dehydrogenase-like predicted oxidoreductase
MEQRRIGELSVPVVGLGCNNFGRRLDAAGTAAVVDACFDAGIDFFDTADMYGEGLSEEYLGKALQGRRDEVTIATKFGAPGSSDEGVARGSAAWIRTAVERSLGRLGTDRIDLYQIHFPDPEVPIAETLGALHDLVQAGKVREIGCSNFGSTRLHEAASAAKDGALTPFRTVQNRYSALFRDPEAKVVPACQELGLGLIPYFPLESGLLTGKYRAGVELPEGTRLAGMPEDQRARFLADDTLERVENLRGYAEERGHTLLELAISWLATNPVVSSVIAGATKPEQVHANAAAAGWRITDAERAEIEELAG